MKIHRRVTIFGDPSQINVISKGELLFRRGDTFELLEYSDSWTKKANGKPRNSRYALITVPEHVKSLSVRKFNPKTKAVTFQTYLGMDEEVEFVSSWEEEDAAGWKASPMPDNCKRVAEGYFTDEGDD